MISSVSKKITELFINNNIIKSEDKEIYSYGLEYIISSVLPIIFALVISLIIGMTGSVIIYMLTFVLFRIFAGGYHASSHLKCQILFYTTLAINVLIIRLITMLDDTTVKYLTVLISVIASGIIFWLAPIDNENKPFSKDEYIKFKIRTRILNSIILLGLIIGLRLSINTSVFLSIAMAILTIAISLIFAKKGRGKDEESTVLE
ncbi:MAG: accessory gene regulator B family protein [Clostridiaceae bacterium]|nr:accessory gene regulator B family protein [Clostridiaceae bacterium]